MRKAKHFLLMAAMLLCSIGASAETLASGSCGENLTWTLTEEGELIIEGEGEMTNYGPRQTPWFGHRTLIKQISMGAGVTSIGDYAFYELTELLTVDISKKVSSIGNYAFYGCGKLTSVDIPTLLTAINYRAFSKCGLTSVTIPEGVKSIDYAAFGLCSNLTSVTLPQSLTDIASMAFGYCENLKDIVIPSNVTSIGDYAFSDCSSLTSIVVAEGNTVYDSRGGCNAIIETSSNTLIQGCSTTIIPESVTSIGDYAFSGCSSLTSITIPESVTSIGEQAFYGCSSLTAITLPESVTSIGSSAFSDCPELTDVYCYAEKVPSTVLGAFDGSYIEYATLHVPASAVNEYKNTAPWSGFGKFETTSIAVASITLSASSATLTEGESLTLTATVSPDDAEDKSVSWSSSNPSIATVDNAGKVTAIVPGTAIITATANDGSGMSASCEVTVTPASYIITFLVDGEVYATETLKPGATITVPDAPTKEGHTFSGWSGLPETMPAKDITVSATFTVNKYLVTFTVDGVAIVSDSLEYGAPIVPPTMPEREGYTFSGWGDVAETVPASDVTYEGSYTANLYNVYYFVGATLVHSVKVAYGEPIPEYIYEPEEEGYTFLGWIGETYATMPAHDVTYTANIDNGIGTLTIDCSQLNIYDLTGRKVADTENLKGGIYIINGKKVVIK